MHEGAVRGAGFGGGVSGDEGGSRCFVFERHQPQSFGIRARGIERLDRYLYAREGVATAQLNAGEQDASIVADGFLDRAAQLCAQPAARLRDEILCRYTARLRQIVVGTTLEIEDLTGAIDDDAGRCIALQKKMLRQRRQAARIEAPRPTIGNLSFVVPARVLLRPVTSEERCRSFGFAERTVRFISRAPPAPDLIMRRHRGQAPAPRAPLARGFENDAPCTTESVVHGASTRFPN